MATSSKKNKSKINESNTNQNQNWNNNNDIKKKSRLSFGIFFVFAGVFICFSLVSYCFTWDIDQDKILVPGGLNYFLWQSHEPVANWGGRLGAAVAHIFMFKGMGIASFFIGIWPITAGINLLNKSKYFPIIKYFRWFSMLTLIGAPIITYLNPNSGFPFGGAWGNEAVTYLNGLIGKAGTGMLLLSICCFVLFVIIALDIKPLLSKAKNVAIQHLDEIKSTDLEEATQEEKEEIKNDLESKVDQPTIENATDILAQYKTQSPNEDSKKNTNSLIIIPENALAEKEEINPYNTEESDLDEDNDFDEENDLDKEVNLEEVVINQSPTQLIEDMSFEVFQQDSEPKAIVDDHISVADTNEPYDPEQDLSNYKFPTLDLIEERSESMVLDKEELEKNKNQIIQTLKSFGIEIQRISATVGPTVTLYEIVPAEGVRISKIRNLEDDIALNLAALGIRIIAPIPGKGTIGIEVPNANKQIVGMKALLSSEKFVNSKMSLPIALGKKIDNENYIVDLATMPHLLMAGATGQGKSVGINAILVSLLYKKHPSQLKFVMIDPKKVELSIYRVIEKHFLAKLPNEDEAIITDTKKVIYTLNALCIEMDNRYELLKEAGTRNIKEYNDKFVARRLNPLRGHKFLPFIVLVIDEFANLIMTAGKEVEMPIARLAQLARAVGIHLIIATQKPSVNVITGTIKANFPGRIAFKVSAKVDSRTILDTGGAEQLIGRGDMLVSHGSELLRVQCAFVDTPEVEKVVNFIGNQMGYPTAFELPEYEGDDEDVSSKIVDLTNRDKLFEDCAKEVVQTQSGSTSMLQRRFNLGYNRAGRIMDQLESAGIVGPASGSKPRDVLIHTEAELDQLLSQLR